MLSVAPGQYNDSTLDAGTKVSVRLADFFLSVELPAGERKISSPGKKVCGKVRLRRGAASQLRRTNYDETVRFLLHVKPPNIWPRSPPKTCSDSLLSP